MGLLPVHGSRLKILGGADLAAAWCVVVGLTVLTSSHLPCLGLNKAGGEGSYSSAPALLQQSPSSTKMQPSRSSVARGDFVWPESGAGAEAACSGTSGQVPPADRGMPGPIRAAAPDSRRDARRVWGDFTIPFAAMQQAGGGRGLGSHLRRGPRDGARIRIHPDIQRACGTAQAQQDGMSGRYPSARLPACAEGYPSPFFPDNDSDIGGNPRRAAQGRGSHQASFCGEPWIAAATHGGTRGTPDADRRHVQGRHPQLAKYHDGNGGGAALFSRDGRRSSPVRWGPRFCEVGPSTCAVVAAAARWKACILSRCPALIQYFVVSYECLTELWAQSTVMWGRMPCAGIGLHVKLPSAAQCCMLPSSRRHPAGQQDARVQRDGGLQVSHSKEPDVLYRSVFLFSRIMQPMVLTSSDPTRQLLMWQWFDDYALPWVFGLSF